MQTKIFFSRRRFLVFIGVAAAALLISMGLLAKSRKKPVVRFGMITDVHYADREPAKGRYYNQSLDKLNEFINKMNYEKVDFIVELGDFKDQDEVPNEANTLKYLSTVESVFHQFNGPTYHVLGNHDMDGITKTQFLERVENTGIAKDQNYYSFDQNGVHFIVLDGNYTVDGNDYNKDNYTNVESWIPPVQVSWLKEDLKAHKLPTIVFIHQLLGDSKGMKKSAQNAPEVRRILEHSGNVLCVFEGHVNSERHSVINHIHYYSFNSTVFGSGLKNNSYVIAEVSKKGDIRIHGYREASDQELKNK
jgi:predicted MPP superfamily phosphohydrolase